MKALGLVVSDKKMFEICILKTYFLTPWPTYATNQNYLNNFVGDHLGTIPVQFGQIPISGSRENVVNTLLYTIQCKIVTPGPRSILTEGA